MRIIITSERRKERLNIGVFEGVTELGKEQKTNNEEGQGHMDREKLNGNEKRWAGKMSRVRWEANQFRETEVCS